MKKQVEIDLKKIFLTPPNTRMEKITLLVMMVVVFVVASANGRSLSLANRIDMFPRKRSHWPPYA